MMQMNNVAFGAGEEERYLLSRVDDGLERARRGTLFISDFLNGREQALISARLCALGLHAEKEYLFFGGYPYAERQVLFLFPEYFAVYEDAARQSAYLSGAARESGAVRALSIQGSGYRELSHRDYLGSLTSLGIERFVIGDIVPCDPYSAVAFFCEKIAGFVQNELRRIGSDAVSVRDVTDAVQRGQLLAADPHRYEEFTFTVASPRLDGLIAGMLGLSREAAQQLIRRGLVEIDHETVEKCDAMPKPPCLLGVRGYGRYRFSQIGTQSRRGRWRITAQKYL